LVNTVNMTSFCSCAKDSKFINFTVYFVSIPLLPFIAIARISWPQLEHEWSHICDVKRSFGLTTKNRGGGDKPWWTSSLANAEPHDGPRSGCVVRRLVRTYLKYSSSPARRTGNRR